MHIPSEMLHGGICPVTAAVAMVGVAVATWLACRVRNHPSPLHFALVSAVVFALQMLNYPLWGGLSAHLLGGVLASALLGTPLGILSVAVVLLLQSVLFADGGLLMLGANVCNMSLIGAGIGGVVYRLSVPRLGRNGALLTASVVSVMLAVGALCAELAVSGVGNADLYASLVSRHLPVAVVEGLATLVLYRALTFRLSAVGHRSWWWAYGGLLMVALLLSPLVSYHPDVLEGTLSHFHLLPGAPDFVRAPLADYHLPHVAGYWSTWWAALAGMGATLLLSQMVGQVLVWVKARKG
ncbi:MAG: energy-coupling factor ABC transporter permease [Prevotella sp.]|nr:energy-coupling factor ABC transporter permease [Prevotella sp.]